jgi:LysM repeat protein
MRYTVVRGNTLSKIAAKYSVTVSQLLAANPRYKPNPNRIGIGDKIEIPGAAPAAGKTARTRKKAAPHRDDPLQVDAGQLTFDAEGNDNSNSRYFSRRPHVPSGASGVTIGRGYDVRLRFEQEVIDDLREVGLGTATARRLAAGAGLVGDVAKAFIKDNGLKDQTITSRQQKDLFDAVYSELGADVLRICTKADVVAKYGRTDWQALDPRLRDVVIDLRYRGDYHPRSRQEVQPILAANDVEAMAALMGKRSYWERFGVPRDRYRRRRDYLA